ncbi:MAG: hypothetical protein SGILL_004909, partial [Bacillariaceae sp.]
SRSSSSNTDPQALGLNELQTLLREAVQRQDFVEAGSLSEELFVRLYGAGDDMSSDEKKQKRKKMSWNGLGTAPWLTNRLEALNYTFPTTIQINTMESVNAILNETSPDEIESTSLEERVNTDMGVVVSGSTGSGKTLAYLVPLLSTLSDSLFARQRVRVGAEESIGDFSGDLVDRISVVTSPVVQTNTKKPVRAGAIATGAALSTLGKSGKDVKSPLALIVVPTRELGIQTAMLVYELVGGSIKKDPTDIRGKANMFKYKGPKGVRVGCILDDAEAKFGLKLQTDVAITTPQYVGKLIADEDLNPSKVRVVVFDEADLALEQTSPKDLSAIFDTSASEDYVPYERDNPRLSFMVGASVTEALGSLAVKARILPQGKSYIATATGHSPILADGETQQPSSGLLEGDEPKTASLKDLDVCLDPGLKHQRILLGNETSGLLVLTRLLRKELQDFDESPDRDEQERPRVVVFFPDEDVAREAIVPLRDALWGEHKLCVLLPKTGVNPLEMMSQFKSNETTVMLATPNSVRGLDFPAVSHVYTLYLPTEDPREYVHLAGRTGRVGQRGSVRGTGGRVVSILKKEDADKMNDMASNLGFEFADIEAINTDSDIERIFADLASNDDDNDEDDDDSIPSDSRDFSSPEDLDKARRYLEDAVSLLSTDADVTIDVEAETHSDEDED